MDSISMTIDGLSDMLRRLRAAPEAMQSKVLRGAVASGAAVIRKEAVLRAPVYTGTVQAGHPPPGTLKAAIYQARLTAQCTPSLEVWMVNVRKGKAQQNTKQGNRDAYYASWVEYGTVKMAARPFMRPAFESTKGAAVEAMRQFIGAKLGEVVA